jgi:hypothetical protein
MRNFGTLNGFDTASPITIAGELLILSECTLDGTQTRFNWVKTSYNNPYTTRIY